MECNKDEALRAKSIAEAKLGKKDFLGAKKFALKALSLYPTLDGVSQMLTTLEVYVSAERKIKGAVDWYGVLGVGPTADDETIKKQYRKLALVLHPDKNNSAGANDAFNLISEAWNLLSDKAKRSAYNQNTGLNGFEPKAPTGPSARTGGPTESESLFSKCANTKPPAPKIQKTKIGKGGAGPPKPSPPPPDRRIDTFWTVCGHCKVQYEYQNVYRNMTLLCPNCKNGFNASEIPRLIRKPEQTKLNPGPAQRPESNNNNLCPPPSNVNLRTPSSANDREKNVTSDAKKTGAGPLRSPPSANNGGSGPPPVEAGLNTFMHVDPHSASSSVTRAADIEANASVFGHRSKRAACPDSKKGSVGVGGFSKKRKLDDGHNIDRNLAETVHEGVVTRKLLLENARKEVSRKMNELGSEEPVVKPRVNRTTRERERINVDGQKCSKNRSNGSSADNTSEEIPGMIMNVPDPDFYDFDRDRTADSFSDNEVWAAYDNDDGMPRFYAMIQKVISKKTFKLKISWLNSKTTVEFGRLDWIGSGFYKTCGEFWVGKYELCKFVNAFSQRVKWSKGPRGSVVILPRKGDVWALYRNWSPDWDTSISDDVIHKYDMVMVLDDYNEDKGVSVSRLVKVIGYKTVFCPNMGTVVEISKEEMFRFSHLVPYHGLDRREAPDAPEGCMELDPAATPSELLQTEAEDVNANCTDV